MTRFSAENKRRYFESYFVIKPLIEPIVYRSMGKKIQPQYGQWGPSTG